MTLTDEGLMQVAGLHSRWVKLRNGSRAHYVTAGEDGPAVILLHGGLPGSSGTVGWRFMAPFLGAHGFRVFCPDQPGFGLSDSRREYWPHLGILSHLEFVEQFADALCLDTFLLAGNSMGCCNAAHFTVRYPHRVVRLALIAGMIGAHHPIDLQKHGRVPEPWSGDKQAMGGMLRSITHSKGAVTDELLEMRSLAADRQKESWDVFRTTVLLGDVPEDVQRAISTKDRLDKLDIPGIFLWGLDDAALPVALGYEIEETLPRVQFFYPRDCGHQGQSDQPELFNQVFLEFFRDGRVQRSTADAAGVSIRRPESAALVVPPPHSKIESAAGVA